MKTGIFVALAALTVVGLGVGVVAAQTVATPHTPAGGMQGGTGGSMLGGQHGAGMMGNGGCACGNYQSCQESMNDHNYSWDHNYSRGGMMP